MPSFQDLYLDHVAASFDKQLSFSEKLSSPDSNMGCDLQTGKLTISEVKTSGGFFKKKTKVETHFDVQLLGSESYISSTWKWIWDNANPGAQYPETILQDAAKLKSLGEADGIKEFSEGTFAVPEMGGEHFALVASGLMNAISYFPLNYDGGCAYVLCYESKDLMGPATVENPVARVLTVFPQVLSNMDIIDHKRALRAYCQYYKMKISDTADGAMTAEHAWGSITAKFDEQGRLVDMSGSMAKPQ